MRILVFDTETTGLPLVRNPSIFQTNKWPFMCQLSYITYDTIKQKVVSHYNSYVKLDPSISIPPDATKVHGITNEKCQQLGQPIDVVLDIWDAELREADLIVGHNISFDKRILMVEAIRKKRPQYFTVNTIKKPEYCTMKNNVDRCKFQALSKTGETYYRYPKLFELHNLLFGYIPQGLHDAFSDVLICLRCYMQCIDAIDLTDTDKLFNMLWKTYCV